MLETVVCLLISYYSKENIAWLKQSIEFMANAYDSTLELRIDIYKLIKFY